MISVILLEKISKLGNIGQEVKVKDGFARNYLIPNKKAIRASEENKKIPYYFTKVDDQDIFLTVIHNQGQFCVITRDADSIK